MLLLGVFRKGLGLQTVLLDRLIFLTHRALRLLLDVSSFMASDLGSSRLWAAAVAPHVFGLISFSKVCVGV